MPPTIRKCNNGDEDEEYFPTASLDDEERLEGPIQERDLCIHIVLGRPKTNYTSWTTTYPLEYIPEQNVASSQECIPEQAAAYPQEYIPAQATAYPQEYIPEQAAAKPQESATEAVTLDEVLSALLNKMPDIVDDPIEELIQEFILESWA